MWTGLEPPLPSRETCVVAGGRTIRILHPTDIDGLIRDASEEKELPFWAYVWPAGVSLARFILEGPGANVEGQVLALELGTGVGLVGIAARLAGWRVIQTDLAPLSTTYARLNSRLNGVDYSGFIGDWRRLGLRGRFDRILAADILYEPTLHDAVEQILIAHLFPHGSALIADPCRDYGLDFMAGLERRGWRIEAHNSPPDPNDDARIVTYEAHPPSETRA